MTSVGRGRRLTFDAALGALVAAVGLAIGSRRVGDNSLLTHLAVGHRFWTGHGLPHHDPFTFTAAGQRWVVQSWLAAIVMGGAEKAFGLVGVRLLFGFATAALAALCWRLTRSAGVAAARLALVAPLLLLGVQVWSQRPFLFALALLAAVLVIVEERLDPRWLVPIGWVWVEVHGSWPLGFVALGALAVGAHLDGDAVAELRALKWLTAGLLLGVVNPYGPAMLIFPVSLLQRHAALAAFVEWQAPKFDSASQYGFLVLVALTIVAHRRKPSWRRTVPFVVFLLAALLGARNLSFTAIVLLPGAAGGLVDLPRVGGFAPEQEKRMAPIAGLVALALAAVVTVGATRAPSFDDRSYPVAATRYLEAHHLGPTDVRVITRDFVGNWYEYEFGTAARVWMDDRAELLPGDLIHDYRLLLGGRAGWQVDLARYQPDVVLWDVNEPLTQLLELDPGWKVVYRDRDWVAFTPT